MVSPPSSLLTLDKEINLSENRTRAMRLLFDLWGVDQLCYHHLMLFFKARVPSATWTSADNVISTIPKTCIHLQKSAIRPLNSCNGEKLEFLYNHLKFLNIWLLPEIQKSFKVFHLYSPTDPNYIHSPLCLIGNRPHNPHYVSCAM